MVAQFGGPKDAESALMNEASSNDDGQISKRVQMPYQAYFDESGSSDSEVYCIAGWIATSEVWKEVSIQWQVNRAGFAGGYLV